MGPQDVHSFFNGIFADIKQNHAFFHIDTIDFIPCFKRLSGSNAVVQVLVAGLLCFCMDEIDAFPFRFTVAQKIQIAPAKFITGLQLRSGISFPSIFLFH